MRKFIFIFVAMFTMFFVSANAQTKFSGTIGITAGIEPHNSNYIAFPLTADGSLGARFSNGFYVGGGISLGDQVEYGHDKWYSQTLNTFIMPIYAHFAYNSTKTPYYADVKIGVEEVFADNDVGEGFYLQITPLGYSFDKHNSIGIGWRFHGNSNWKGHSIAFRYQYMF